MSRSPADRIATLARVAELREDRAERALRVATAERIAREAAEARAKAAHDAARDRQADARARAMAEPNDPATWLWASVKRSTCDDARDAHGEANEARECATREAARCRDDWSQRHVRTGTMDDRVARARRAEAAVRENRQADDAVPASGKGPR